MSKITTKDIKIKLEKFNNTDGKEKHHYEKVGVAFISENGTLTGIQLKSWAIELLTNKEVRDLNTKDGHLNLQVFQDKKDSTPHFENRSLESDNIPF